MADHRPTNGSPETSSDVRADTRSTSDDNDHAGSASIVFQRLSEEFGARLEPEVIWSVAIEEVAIFGDPPVRDFIPILASRSGRTRLAQDVARRHARRGRGFDV